VEAEAATLRVGAPSAHVARSDSGYTGLPVSREFAALRPVLVFDLVNEHLDVLGTHLIGVHERFCDAGDEPALAFDVTR